MKLVEISLYIFQATKGKNCEREIEYKCEEKWKTLVEHKGSLRCMCEEEWRIPSEAKWLVV